MGDQEEEKGGAEEGKAIKDTKQTEVGWEKTIGEEAGSGRRGKTKDGLGQGQ